jgi:hypothetical protein
MSFLQMPNIITARHFFLGQSGRVLSGAAAALLAGKHALAAQSGEASSRGLRGEWIGASSTQWKRPCETTFTARTSHKSARFQCFDTA